MSKWVEFLSTPTKPWWALHLHNAIGSTMLLAVAIWHGNVWFVAGMGILCGASNLNGCLAWHLRIVADREGLDLDALAESR